jgi:hypothetical protein
MIAQIVFEELDKCTERREHFLNGNSSKKMDKVSINRGGMEARAPRRN